MAEGLWDEIKDWGKAAIPFLGAGLDFLGGLLGNSANAEEAARNRRFVAQMYKKRYQFTVDDMRKAGLNPVLAANGGNVGSVSSTPLASFENPFHGAVSSAVSTANAVQDVQNKIAQRDLTESQTGLNQSKKVSQDIQNKYLDPQARSLAEKALHDASIANSAAEIQRARAQFAQDFAQLELGNKRLTNSALVEQNMQRRLDWQSKELDYYSRPKGKEAIFWDRLERGSKAVGRGVNSALGLGKLKYLSKAIR